MEITKSDIIKLIERNQTDSFETHFLTILKRDQRPSGEVQNREVRIWKQYGWNRTFYPIFKFEFNKDLHLINISNRINPVGKIVFILLCGLVSIPWLFWIVDDFNPLDHWMQIIACIIFLGAFVLIGLKVYKVETQIQLEHIYDFLEMEIQNQEREKEWGWKKIITRLITYPLSIFLIVISMITLIPQGKYIHAFLTIGIVAVYLYSDIRIILNNKKTTGNNAYN